jgi:hypothetical protein
MVLMLCLAAMPARAQKAFASPEAAMQAFGEAVATSDDDALKIMLGANFRTLIPPLGADARYRFLQAWSKQHSILPAGDDRALIAAGDDGWTLPIPLVKAAQGWKFDLPAGVEEMRVRRVGRNENRAMLTMQQIADAQRRYVMQDYDGDGLRVYAAKLTSSSGKQDGLYWPIDAKLGPSPLGREFSAAEALQLQPSGYNGYRFKLLTAQGPHAPGGAMDYVVRGKLFGGFGIVAWPIGYRDTGVMTFIVNHQGQVYERDLGPDSAARAAAMKSFDPGPGWRKVSP